MILKIKQKKDGYRFSVDSTLLANFITSKKNDVLLEIGTGSGIISLLLCEKFNIKKIYGIEIQKNLYALAKTNVIKKGFEKKIVLINKDIKEIKKSELPQIDIVFSNPPYRHKNSGRKTSNEEKYLAKHEIAIDLESLIKCAYKFLKDNGKLFLVYPSSRLAELMSVMQKNSIEPKRMQVVYASINSKSKLILIEGVKKGRISLEIEKPIIL